MSLVSKSATPTSRSVSLVSKSATPTSRSVSLVSKSATPTSRSVSLVSKSATPTSRSVSLVSKSATPTSRSVSLVSKSATPTSRSVSLVSKSATPTSRSVSLVSKSATPTSRSVSLVSKSASHPYQSVREFSVKECHPFQSVREFSVKECHPYQSVREFSVKECYPYQSVREFPGECLAVSGGNLFCSACREPVSLKKSIIKLHLDSQKHKNSRNKLLANKAKQRSIAESLRKYDEEGHPKGETLPENVRVYRVTVVKSFLKAGIPLSKVDCMRHLLEEHGFSLSGRQRLSETIPVIHQQEVEEIKKKISGKKVSVIFNGTTHTEEALAVLLRFVDNFQTTQRLICLKLLSKSMTPDNAKAYLFETPEQEYDSRQRKGLFV